MAELRLNLRKPLRQFGSEPWISLALSLNTRLNLTKGQSTDVGRISSLRPKSFSTPRQ